MKPFELFQQLESFNAVMAMPDIPASVKLQLAREYKTSLPPAAFSAGCTVTRAFVECEIQKVIDTLEATNDRREEETGTPEAKAPSKKGKR